jgi:hypothetical protein
MMAADYPALARELAADHLDPLGVLQVNGLAGGSWVVPVANLPKRLLVSFHGCR